MYYVKNSLGEEIPITNTNVFTHCPKCGVEHKADLVSLIIEHGEDCPGDILDSSMHCEECSKAHLPMYERMDEIEFVASRFPGTSVGTVAEIVRNGLDRGFSFDTALVGAKLALAMTTGQEALFTLDEVASALGCTKEDAEAEMEQLGISPIKATTLPGFEWALGENR